MKFQYVGRGLENKNANMDTQCLNYDDTNAVDVDVNEVFYNEEI